MLRASSEGPPPGPTPRASRRQVLALATGAGASVANLYYAQPLLQEIARTFHAGAGAAGLVVTATQVGYAAGLLFLVPLGDLVERRRLVATVLVGTAGTLAAAAAAPTLPLFAAALLLVGIASVVAQVLVPFAADLAPDGERGRVVGTVMTGLLLGILLARTAAGLVAQAGGFRAIYALSAVLMVVMAALLRRALPEHKPAAAAARLGYPQLLRSISCLLRDLPVLRRRAAYGALLFASFSVFWTALAFLLSGPPYGYNQSTIGLFGLVGAAGALAASLAGRAGDRGLTRPATGFSIALTLASFALLAAGGRSLVALLAGILALDFGVQGAQVLNQGEIYRLRPDARSRITTAYMTCYFAGGALGSVGAGAAFQRWGWAGICAMGACFSALALTIWLTELRPRAEV